MARRSHPPQDYSGEAETGTPCARGRSCAEADYQGNGKACPRAFCEKDRQWIGNAIRDMPRTYVDLRMLLARSGQSGERVTTTREAPIPIATDIDAFMREIVWITCSWEEAVAGVARLADYPDGHRRDSVALADACRTLYRQLDILLSLPETEMSREASRARVSEIIDAAGDEPENGTIRYDAAGDARENVKMDGTDAGLEFLWLNGRARGMLGLNRQRRRITEVDCDECQTPRTLVQWEAWDGGWEPVVRCTACPNAYTGASYELLMGRIYQAQLAALEKHGKVA